MKLRGLFPSLGAGGSLIAAAVCALAVFGGVLAFRGERPATAEANSGDLVVPDGRVRAQTSSPGLVPTVLTLAARGERVAATETSRRAQGRLRTPQTRRPGDRPSVATPTQPPASQPVASTPPRSNPGARPPAAKPDAPTAPPAPAVPTGNVQHVVEQTSAAVQPIVEAAPAPVQAPVQQVTDTVQDVAGTVDQTVDGVTGLVLPKR
jgi:hypothetical protein